MVNDDLRADLKLAANAQTSARATRVIFEAMLAEGFSEEQALRLTMSLMTAGLSG